MNDASLFCIFLAQCRKLRNHARFFVSTEGMGCKNIRRSLQLQFLAAVEEMVIQDIQLEIVLTGHIGYFNVPSPKNERK